MYVVVLSVILLYNILTCFLQAEASDKISAFLFDSKRVIRSYCSMIDTSPLQVNSSAIVFAPEQSVVRRTFRQQFPAWLALPPNVDSDWDSCIQTLEGHSSSVDSVAFSRLKTLVSGSSNETIKLWDMVTGAYTATLKGHGSLVHVVAFSHDSKTLASGSSDQTIKLWDAPTGACTATLETGMITTRLTFDITSSFLYTDIGILALNKPSSSPVSMAAPGPSSTRVNCWGIGLSEDSTWVTRDSYDALWLPPIYRPGKLDIIAGRMVIGCTSGRVLILELSSLAVII
jgi:WD40 repeat protein